MRKKQTCNPGTGRGACETGQTCAHPHFDAHTGVRVFPPVLTVFSPRKDLSKPDCLLSAGEEASYILQQVAESSGALLAAAMIEKQPEKLAGCQSPPRPTGGGVSSLQFKRAEQWRNWELFMF